MFTRKHAVQAGVSGFALALALGVGYAASAQASPSKTSASRATPAHPAAHSTVQHFVLVDHTGPTEYNDIGKKGSSVGDAYIFSETIDRGTKKVGFAGGVCTDVAVTATSESQQCEITAELHDGQFTIQGLATYGASAPSAVTYAITGGTGAYRDARGQVTVTPVNESSDRIVVDIITG